MAERRAHATVSRQQARTPEVADKEWDAPTPDGWSEEPERHRIHSESYSDG
jgi:hypothetical protein